MERKRYEILESLPAYGPMHTSITNNNQTFYSEGFVVRFYKSDHSEWVANFKPGCTELKEVCELKCTPNLLVIANGTCYLMDPEETKPVSVFGADYVSVFKVSDGRLVLQDETSFTIIETNGNYWNTLTLSYGFAEIKVIDNIISGLLYQPTSYEDEWFNFTYNINTKISSGGIYNEIRKKPWWKFW